MVRSAVALLTALAALGRRGLGDARHRRHDGRRRGGRRRAGRRLRGAGSGRAASLETSRTVRRTTKNDERVEQDEEGDLEGEEDDV